MRRSVQLDLDPEMSRFLNQEKSRLQTRYGIKVSLRDIILVLLKQHKMRVLSEAEEERALLWYYDILKDYE